MIRGRRILGGAATMAVGLGLAVTIAPPASAHTPGWKVDCPTGITLTGTNYNANEVNKWSITLNGVVQSGTFGSTLNKNVTVPQEGATSTWAVSIDAPGTQYDLAKSGTVGPCGTPPPPPPVVPPQPPTPPTLVPPPPAPPVTQHAKTHVRVVDRCSCYRDSVTMTGGDHVRIKASHLAPTVWVFKVTADDGYLLPSRIGGHSGWAPEQTYRVTTTNTVCPCKKRGDCAQLYPGFTPPSVPCRGDCKGAGA